MEERHEPAIDTVSAAASRLGLSLEQCVVVEDTASGILAAKKAGCKTIEVFKFIYIIRIILSKYI